MYGQFLQYFKFYKERLKKKYKENDHLMIYNILLKECLHVLLGIDNWIIIVLRNFLNWSLILCIKECGNYKLLFKITIKNI